MAKVTLTVGEDALQQMYNDLTDRKRDVLALLDELNTNLDAVSAALRALRAQETIVFSETNPYRSYKVTLEGDVFKCTCPSYEYSNGLDYKGHCKHIRKVIDEGRFDW